MATWFARNSSSSACLLPSKVQDSCNAASCLPSSIATGLFLCKDPESNSRNTFMCSPSSAFQLWSCPLRHTHLPMTESKSRQTLTPTAWILVWTTGALPASPMSVNTLWVTSLCNYRLTGATRAYGKTLLLSRAHSWPQ